MFTDGLKLGVAGHERRGEKFLRELGVPEVISSIALGHVNAKRYLCYKDPAYYSGRFTLLLYLMRIHTYIWFALRHYVLSLFFFANL